MVRRQLKVNEVPQILLQARPASQHPGYRAVREDLNVAHKSRGFFGPRQGASGKDQGPRLERSSIQQLKLRTSVCKMSQSWTLGSRVFRRKSRTTQRRKVRSTCGGTSGKLKRVRHGSKAHGTKTFQSRRFLDIRHSRPWRRPVDAGAQEGLVGKQQLDKWCQLLAEHDLQVEWSQEKPDSASGIGGVTQPIFVVYVPVGLAGCNVSSDSLLWSRMSHLYCRWVMRTLQASLDLNDDGDKVTCRQFGGESSLRTLQSGHTVSRADQFDPDGWQLPEITELCQNNDKGCATNCMSVIAHVYQRPRCMDDDTPAGTMTQHPHAVADNGRRQHRTATDLRDLIRQISPRHHLGSRVVNKCTVIFIFTTMSGISGLHCADGSNER